MTQPNSHHSSGQLNINRKVHHAKQLSSEFGKGRAGINENISRIHGNKGNTRMSLDDSVADLIRPQNPNEQINETASLRTEIEIDGEDNLGRGYILNAVPHDQEWKPAFFEQLTEQHRFPISSDYYNAPDAHRDQQYFGQSRRH